MKNMKTWVAILVLIAAVAICGWYAVRTPGDVVKEGQQADNVVVEAEATAEPTEAPAEAPAEELALLNDEEGEQEELMTIEGEIVEVTDEYMVIKDAVQGEVQVNFSDDTVFEGIVKEELAAGQFASVIYNGMMTRSLPPQISALSIRVDAITGTVAEVQEDGRVLLNREDIEEQVIVVLPEGVELTAGEKVTIYTNGIATMSLPPQMIAIGVVK